MKQYSCKASSNRCSILSISLENILPACLSFFSFFILLNLGGFTMSIVLHDIQNGRDCILLPKPIAQTRIRITDPSDPRNTVWENHVHSHFGLNATLPSQVSTLSLSSCSWIKAWTAETSVTQREFTRSQALLSQIKILATNKQNRSTS